MLWTSRFLGKRAVSQTWIQLVKWGPFWRHGEGGSEKGEKEAWQGSVLGIPGAERRESRVEAEFQPHWVWLFLCDFLKIFGCSTFAKSTYLPCVVRKKQMCVALQREVRQELDKKKMPIEFNLSCLQNCWDLWATYQWLHHWGNVFPSSSNH